MCRGADPESKGKIESVVKYIKGNYLENRLYVDDSILSYGCLEWLERTANAKIHGTTKRIPREVFACEREYLRPLVDCVEKYEPDVSMFIGHIGCKHTWASAKIGTDMIQEKYGLPSLYLDVDGIDGLYKSLDEIKGSVGQYMDTVVNK